MKSTILLILFLCFHTHCTYAQHEADNWYFGHYAGLSFKSGSPVALSDGQLNANEGCATVSDKETGELLFYTNGVTIWNSKHEIMTNGTGLKGGSSSTQSALIVPNPANKLQYYVFTSPDLTSGGTPTTTSAFYSIVSMESPFGTVISKNNFLIDSVSEKLTGTIDCDGTGFWVVTHHVSKGIFYSFHISASGINAIPTVSSYLFGDTSFAAGCMKTSPNSSKIAVANIVSLSLFDFDASTGSITNYIPLRKETNPGVLFYGLSFSPDNTKLYASRGQFRILQFEVNLPDSASICNSELQLKSTKTMGEGMQIAPDGKIYIAQIFPSRSLFLSVIDKPNLKGNDCIYREDAVPLTDYCLEGLPYFMDYIFNSTSTFPNCAAPIAMVLPDSTCIGNNLIFTDRSTLRPNRREWTFENGMPPTSSDSIVSVSYSKVGTHRVRLVVSNNNGSDTTYAEAIIFPIPTAIAGTDTTICMGETVQLGTKSEMDNTYSWQPAIGLSDASVSNPTASPTQTTQYTLTVKNIYGCINHDTVRVAVNTPDEHLFTLTPSTITIHPGEQFQASLNVPSGIHSWRVHINYDDLVVRFSSIVQPTNGIIATTIEEKGQLTVSGIGDSGTVFINFIAYLPYNYDTAFAMTMMKDSTEKQQCGSIATQGNTLELGEFCARKFRIIRSTGKGYFLAHKENSVNFGVGLSGKVRLELYDYTGTLKEVLADGTFETGEYSLDFDLPTGIYFCRINAGMYTDIQKVMVLHNR